MSANVETPRPVAADDELGSLLARLLQAETLDDIYGILRTSVRRLVGSDGIALILREGDLCYYAEEDAIGPLWKGKRFSMAACISGWCMLHRETATIPDIATDPRIPQDLYAGTFVRSLVMVPIGKERSIAALGSYWSEKLAASSKQIELLETIARATGVALECLETRKMVANSVTSPEQVDITVRLADRSRRDPDYQSQKRAVHELARIANERPSELLGRLVELAREVCGAESAGISLYEPAPPSAGVFRWHHLSGVLAPFDGATTPRDHSPCGFCLDRHMPILMAHPERAYSWIRQANIVVPEVLLVPLQCGTNEIGTLWVIAPRGVEFDGEHARILTELAGVTSIATELTRLSETRNRG